MITKRGYNRNGAQRLYCKECNRFFVPATNTILSGTHKDAATWRKFLAMTIKGETLAECAAACEIAYPTSHNWRQKILSAFSALQNKTVMSGIVEADEMLVSVSYKGNHGKGAHRKT